MTRAEVLAWNLTPEEQARLDKFLAECWERLEHLRGCMYGCEECEDMHIFIDRVEAMAGGGLRRPRT